MKTRNSQESGVFTDDIVVSINPAQVKEPRCLAFYGKNMRLKRVGK